MSAVIAPAAPAWQTEELQDEWIDLDEHDSDDDKNLTYGTRSISLTAPLATHIHTNSDFSISSSESLSRPAGGTFLVREDIPSVPLLPKTPGIPKKGIIKDFFSPMPLERMFEPPSPPNAKPSITPQSIQQSPAPSPNDYEVDEIIETDIPNMSSFHGRKASIACQFTFTVPRETFLNPTMNNGSGFPQAQSTPNPPNHIKAAPTTDPRLRLFQFQYDTYTREHLSAMVDSIAVHSASGTGTSPSPTCSDHILSRVSEVTDSVVDISHLRSVKRVKLSPPSDFHGEGAGAGAIISRPKVFKDYVGESRSLMQQIKQARDFSTISTVASNKTDSPPPQGGQVVFNERQSHDPRSSFLRVPAAGNTKSSSPSSSLTYREQAATLMAQIKQDMKGHKRLFSEDTATSHFTTQVESNFDVSRLSKGSASVDSPHQFSSDRAKQQSVKSRSPGRKSSPRNPGRRLASNTDSRQLVEDISRLSIQDRRSFSEGSMRSSNTDTRPPTSRVSTTSHPAMPTTLAPPSYPSSSVRAEDLNRFVSSSTASGTTLTAGSAPSFVKHAGPAHIRTIAPTDLPELPDKLGDMLFDKVMMRWVKNTSRAIEIDGGMAIPDAPDEASEDPFGDIESLRDDSKSMRGVEPAQLETEKLHPSNADMSRIEEEMDEEEMDMTSFLTDNPTAMIVDVMTGRDDDETTDSDDDQDDPGQTITNELKEYESDDPLDQSMSKSNDPEHVAAEANVGIDLRTPHRSHSVPATTPVIRSALKSRTLTPASALKDSSKSKYQTPLNKKGHHRSVSFSDGKRDGPIQGLADSADGEEMENFLSSAMSGTSGGFVPSARSRRIAQMMEALEDAESDESPSKTNSSGRSEIQVLSARQPSTGPPSESNRRRFSRSRTHRVSYSEDGRTGNATFLTECSFAVAHDRLVEVITDVQPFVPRWEDLSSIDLSGKKLESVARLKEFLPRLDGLNLNSNQLAWLSGVPSTIRTLSIASNSLTRLTSYSHLLQLVNLDVSQNDIESLAQLACLRHLREIKADGNKITSLEGLNGLDGLVKVSLQGNSLRSVDLTECRWTRLEMLNMSRNRLDDLRGLSSMQALVALNIDNNELGTLEVEGNMPKLRILRLSGNRVQQLQVGGMPNLRTLYADNNALSTLVKLERLTKLENLSVRNQSGRGLNLLTRDIRDVKRLYLSGNPLKSGFLSEACYNLLYLELAACRLTALPEDLARVVPNLRVLNLNYNFLEDARPLEGLTRLKKLTMIGSRLKGTKPLIRILQRMPDVEMLDFRMNPCTLGWYLPLLVRDVPGALQPSEGGGDRGKRGDGGSWQELDGKFRRDLPNELYVGRLAYRGLIMRACPKVRMVDGVEVSEKERAKAQHLLAGILGKR